MIPYFSPELLFWGNNDLLFTLMAYHPRPFQLFSCQLPRRGPFSCVLDMIVHLTGQENEEEIKNRLQQFTQNLMTAGFKKPLFSSTVCISYVSTSVRSSVPVKYYGASVSANDGSPGKIMIAASCLSNWDDCVADAVMTYYPNKLKKLYFNGTINLPANVICRAFKISNRQNLEPCRSCGNMFGLQTRESHEWAYGNCAEAESLSNLLRNERQVKDGVLLTSGPYQQVDRNRARTEFLNELRNELLRVNFTRWNGNFYQAQRRRFR
ncbi:uncharacterized protein LOC133461157 [Cololabis saira]|uniref:uncharacterized protein LOC133461157 n=1 Tax=Cololabis saira TaxID=129043 RepID=UPI002AD36FE1|nr:uncharacterized protein LOC133461157 [Cololabis saira]